MVLYAIALKFVLTPVFAFLYWLVAIKGGESLSKLAPEKWRDALTRNRYF